ncbi:ROK family protein, partial [Clostridium sp.]|uniref:ROK family protein n=1 Tax=Clostridium sp. TaxID=1506 RepID=UPI003F3CDB81
MKSYVCIDIGGTSIKHGVIYEDGKILVKGQRNTEAYKGGFHLLEKMKDIVTEYKALYSIDGICISTCGMVDPTEGKIIYASNAVPNYIGVEIKKELEKEFSLPCEVENDVNCAALGEVWLGAAKGTSSCVCMTIGTGIGGCIIINNEVVHGWSNSAGEVGYMNMDGGTFQEKASTKSLVKNVARRKGLMDSDINGEVIFNLAKAGDSICVEEINSLVDTLALGISNIIYV